MFVYHFKRFWWAYALAVLLVAVPWIIIRAQLLPPLDLESMRVICQRIDTAIVARYGEPINDEYEKAEEAYNVAVTPGKDPRLDRLTDYIPLGGMPSLAEDAREIQAVYGPLLAPFERLDRAGIYYRTFAYLQEKIAAIKDKQEVNNLIRGDVPNLLALSNRAKLYRSLAGQAIGRQDWDDALAQLESSAHAVDPVRVNYLNGHLVAVNYRSIAYGGYADLLVADPPEEILRQTLATLTELRRTDPTDNDLMWLADKRCLWNFLIVRILADKRFAPGPVSSLSGVFGINNLCDTLFFIVTRRDQIRDERLRDWANRFWEDHLEPRLREDSLSYSFMYEIVKEEMSWTFIPSARRWILEVIESQPELIASDIFSVETIRSLDSLTLAILGPGMPQVGINPMYVTIRSKVTLTQGRLMEIAFAARLFEREKGRWPEHLDDLIPAYLPPLEEGYVGDEAKGILTPFRMDWVDMNPELQSKLLGEFLAIRSQHGGDVGFSFDPDSGELNIMAMYHQRGDRLPVDENTTLTVTLDTSLNGRQVLTMLEKKEVAYRIDRNEVPYISYPVLPLALAESMQAHPRLFPGAEALLPTVKIKGRQPSEPEDTPLTIDNAEFDIQFSPLSADYARRVTGESDALYWSSKAQELPPDKRGEAKPDLKERTTAPPVQVVVRSKLNVPERVFVVWSPGPDGKDDGGRIAYDPSNGSLSRGDILAFPERF